ncbi:MAG: hypothetical protein KA028_01095 [Candidatus Pacebacteria bacterium]|jgi:hypothetical protein|nr:hypothetical protein [Candidatus Paceibacterota bacterium]MBP9851808.1 hypothetical protein [Candidatus Paceibacterota bacterium]
MAKNKHVKDKSEVRKHLSRIEEIYKIEVAKTTDHYTAFESAIHQVFYSVQALQNNFNFAWFKYLVKSLINYVEVDKKLQKQANNQKRLAKMSAASRTISQLSLAL